MSRSSAGKKTRRARRQAARNETWLPDQVHAGIRAVARVADVIVPRGWVFDRERSTDVMVTWYFPASATEFDDPGREPLTRIRMAALGDPQVSLVGARIGDPGTECTAETLFARLADIEGYQALL